MLCVAAVLAFVMAATSSLAAQPGQFEPFTETIRFLSSTRWKQGAVVVDIEADLATHMDSLPVARRVVEVQVAQEISSIFVQAMRGVVLDSFNTLEDAFAQEPFMVGPLADVGGNGKREISYLDKGLRVLHLRYSIPFYGPGNIVDILTRHTALNVLPTYVGSVPSAAFTGLIIYGQGQYRAWGQTDLEVRIQPCFFPKIYDEEMNLVLEKGMCDPELIARQGMVAYTDSLDESPFLDRIGLLPLRTMARGVFGKNNTDLIIPRQVGLRMLTREENRRLLREGRILVILDALD